MRKRTLISIIITFVCIALTNRLWFTIKPLQISFNFLGEGNTKFEIFLNKKNNNDFQKVKYGVTEKNLDETDFVQLFIDRVHCAKRVKLTISPPRAETLTLSHFQARYGKYKLDDLNAFSAEGAKLKIDGDKLIIYPQDDTFSIIYNKSVNIKSPTKLDIKLLIVIAVLSFLLAYKLTSYLADFKSLNNASRMDIIFLLIFFVILFIPMSNIDTKTEFSMKENRKFSEYKSFIQKYNINFNFGNDFDRWFNDRFFLRKYVAHIFMKVKFTINKNYNDRLLIKGKENWLFLTPDNSINNYLNVNKFSDKELENTVKYIVSIDRYCKKHNKKFILMICPDKNKIYGEYYPDYFIKRIPDSQSRANQLITELRKNNVDVIYFYNHFMKNKNFDENKLLYWKNDTHWSKYGAYLAYKEFVQHLGIKPISVNFNTTENHIGDLSGRFNIKTTEKYIVPEIVKKESKCEITKNQKRRAKEQEEVFCNFTKGEKRAVIYRDSFTINLIPFLSETFAKSTYYRTYQVSINEIKDADIVVIERVERGINIFQDLVPIKE